MASTVVTYDAADPDFIALLDQNRQAGLPSGLQYSLETSYRAAEHGLRFKDLSFFLLEDGVPQACVFYHKYNENASGFNGSGAQLYFFNQNKKTVKSCFDTLSALASAAELNTILISDESAAGPLGLLGEECLNRDGTAKYKLHVLVDLNQSEEAIHSSIRKSYKSLVNKGRQEMRFVSVTEDNADKELFQSFEDFHLKVAGKKTRPQESWQRQFDMIWRGEAELLMGYMEHYGLVSSALFTDFGKTTSYAVAVYNRDLFDRPLAHANVYEGLVRAKRRGQSCFNLGVIPMYGEATQKELNIAKFKRGFGTTKGFVEWSVPLGTQKENDI